MRSHLKFIGLVIVMGLIGYGLFSIGHRVDTLAAQLQESKADRTALRAELEEQEGAAAKHLTQMKALTEQVERLGGKPVVDLPPSNSPSVGPTATQVRAAVADYCAGDRCKPTVSRSQVAAAVADYCAGGLCQAKDGTDGGPGKDGTDGADGADGSPGPGPTDEQIAAAVEAYCAGGNCGKDGKDGTDGADGKDATFTPSGMDCPEGERVNGVHLLADGSLTVSCAPLIGRGD